MKNIYLIVWCCLMAFSVAACTNAQFDQVIESVEQVTGLTNDDDTAAPAIESGPAELPYVVETELSEVSIDEVETFYAYQAVSEEVRTVYKEVLDTILGHKSEIRLSVYDASILEQAFEAVTADHGELFWIDGYSYTEYTFSGKVTGIEFMPTYTMTESARSQYQSQIDQKNNEILAGLPADASEYDKVKYVFRYLIEHVDYVEGSENNQNILSVYMNGETVCQGYADAAQYLLKLLGIQSAIVTGTANSGAHAWNLIYIDGEPYYFDATWGNSRYQDTDQTIAKYVNYAYMAFTTEEMERTHWVGNDFEVPVCTAINNSYFVKEGLYFSEYAEEEIGQEIQNAWNNNEDRIAVKFATEEDMDMASTTFIDEFKISDYCLGLETVYYLSDRDMNVLMIQFR
ncbi:MAG: transglutaminase domain-containing protein [Lachnospiraceae bacterium]